MKVLLLLTLLASCGQTGLVIVDKTPKDPRKHQITDPAFNKYIEEFETLYGDNINNVPINFNDLDTTTKVGICRIWGTGHTEIEIDEGHWQTMSEDRRLALIFHELGHCALKRDHNDDRYGSDQCPKSYMSENLVSQECIDNHLPQYLEEMFK